MAEEFTPLASSDDVVEALGRALTTSEDTKVEAALAKASELFRYEAQRTFTPGRKTSRLKVVGGEVRLTETPIVTVHSVTDDDGNPVTWTLFATTLTIDACAWPFVRVDYSYGDDNVPELVRTTVAGMVAGAFGLDKRAREGMTQFQEAMGPASHSGTFATWAIGGQVAMSPSDLAIARKLRPVKLGGTVVQSGMRIR